MNLFEKVFLTIKKNILIEPKDRILIGISGGPDSITLLYFLNELKKKYNIVLKAVHIDHMLRAEESKRDHKFTEDLCRSLDIDFTSKCFNVKKIAEETNDSLENTARVIRYDFFKEIALQENFNKIAVGHNSDDQAETILMRIIRGTGLEGLSGMSIKRNIEKDINIYLIRPLLEISSLEIRTYLKKNNISYCTDSSNQELVYFRNKIRHELIPIFEKYNVNAKKCILKMADNLEVIQDYISKQGKRRFRCVCNVKNEKLILDLKRFKRYHEAIKREVFRNAIEFLKGDLKKITYQHWKEFNLLVTQRPTGSIVDFPYSVSAEKRKKSIVFFIKK